MPLPPPPPGFRPDPLATAQAWGVNITNGFRTPADTERLRRAGYHPATNSLHLDGDAIDLTPGKSGLSMGQLYERANTMAAARGGRALNEGDHVHLQIPGWGGAPGFPQPPAGFQPVSAKANIRASASPKVGMFANVGTPTGQVHDGDTFKLNTGKDARLFGVDAFELNQRGRSPSGVVVPLGQQARGALQPFATPSGSVTSTGAFTYGRPVVTLNNGGDAGQSIIRQGLGIAEPNYLKGSPLFSPYMEAERRARLNRTGAFGLTDVQTPAEFRHPDGVPWGTGQAVFWDEPTPTQFGMRPEAERKYIQLSQDPKATADDLIAVIKGEGFQVDEDAVRGFIERRNAGKIKVDPVLKYKVPPAPLIDLEQGAAGSFARGFADPINMYDETAGLAHSLGLPALGSGPRENVWNSDRRFGDILWNNIGQERSILGYDEKAHPVARIGGQLSSALIAPGVSVEGVAGRVTAKALEEGLPRLLAEQLGKRAATRRLAAAGSIEGGLAGGGAGEGNPLQRVPNALAGAALGYGGGYVLGGLSQEALSLYRTLRGRGVPDAEAMQAASAVDDAAMESASVVNDGAQAAGPTPAARNQPQGGVVGPAGPMRPASAAMRVEGDGAELVGPVAPLDRERDYIDVGDIPPPPPGFAPEAPFGVTRPIGERLGAEERANLIRGLDPENVVPRPNTGVGTFEESLQANPGRFEELQAPNPLDELGVRRIGSSRDLFKGTRIRGPFDVTKQVRRWGGVQDQGGELSHLGITNQARRGLEFGGNEQFLGKLVNNEDGMTLDQLGERLYDEGWLNERPTVAEVVDILHREHLGESLYHPESLNEVAAFRSASEEADRIAKFRDEGAPLVDERGAPATLEDMQANTPPAWAYEDVARLSKRIGNIDTGKLETRQDITRALEAVSNRVGGFDAARRGKQSWAETEALAQEMGLTPEAVMARRHGQALNAEEAVALRMMFAKGSDELVTLAKRAKGGDEEALARFHQAALQHAAIYEHVAGSAAEAGRALQSYRMVAKASLHQGRVLKGLVEGAGGADRLREMADKIIELEKVPGALNKFAANMTKPTWKDKLVELWYNSLLSGPQTHAVNILSNAITAAAQPGEHLVAAGIGAVRSAVSRLRGKGDVDRVLMSEVGPRVVGLTQGAAEGLKAFRYTLRTGEVADQVTKVESARQEAISGIKGKIIRVPTHLLSAEDEFFKATARRMEIAGLAVRKARAEGLKGDKLQARIAELTSNPTPEMVEKSMDYARYLTFQRPLGPTMQHVMAITQNQPWLKLFMPFVRTPTNILKFGVERSPLAPLLREVRADLAAGGAKRDLATAKMALGTGLGFLVTQWVQSGMVTGGGPQDENAKRLLMADGWKPYSIKIGDTYYSYRRLDPIASTLGMAADMVDLQSHMTERQRMEVPALVITSFMQNLENKTWLSGLGDLHEALFEPQRYAHGFVERLAGSLTTPALLGQVARTIDPVQRETGEGWVQGVLDSIRSRVPGLSQSLHPRRDAFGREVTNEGGVGPDLASPIFTGTARNDPVVREALRVGASVGRLQRTVGGVRLNDEQFDAYQKNAGELTHQYMMDAISAPDWRSLSIKQQQKALDDAKTEARRDARGMLGLPSEDDEGGFVPPPPPPGFVPAGVTPTRTNRQGMFAGGPR